MPPFPLTPTRDAAACPTFLGRTAKGVGGAAVGIIGSKFVTLLDEAGGDADKALDRLFDALEH